MTANDEGLMVLDQNGWRKVSVGERQILSFLEAYDMSNYKEKEQVKLMGNMVQIPFAEAILRHIKTNILGYNTEIVLDGRSKMAA